MLKRNKLLCLPPFQRRRLFVGSTHVIPKVEERLAIVVFNSSNLDTHETMSRVNLVVKASDKPDDADHGTETCLQRIFGRDRT